MLAIKLFKELVMSYLENYCQYSYLHFVHQVLELYLLKIIVSELANDFKANRAVLDIKESLGLLLSARFFWDSY